MCLRIWESGAGAAEASHRRQEPAAVASSFAFFPDIRSLLAAGSSPRSVEIDFPEKKAVERPAGIRNGCALRGRAGPEQPEWPPPPGHAFILTSTPCLSLWPPVPLVPSLRASSRYSLTITGAGGYVHPCGRVK